MSLSSPALGGTLVSIPTAGTLKRVAWAVVLIIVGVGVLAATAQIRIPLPGTPVPITGQTLGVLLLAAAYGSRLAPASVIAYLALGAAGAPIFQGGTSGMAVLHGATSGYLLGFLVASIVVGRLAEMGWDRSPVMTVAAMVIGNVVIYAFGAFVLSRFVGTGKVWALGIAPFLIGDAIKIAIAAAALPTAWRLKERSTPR